MKLLFIILLSGIFLSILYVALVRLFHIVKRLKRQGFIESCRASLASIAIIFFLFPLMNFLVFSLASLVLGGTATQGYAERGKFYLRDHGEITEVSEAVFNYSLQHEFITSILWYAGMIFWTVSIFSYKIYQFRKNKTKV